MTPFTDRSRCPQCKERVSAFAAGCAICDGGVLYYLIPRSDLAARRFDRVAVIMQSH